MKRNRRKHKHYTPEFRQRAVDLVNELGSITSASQKLGVPHVTLHTWVSKVEGGHEPVGPAKETPEEELKRLRKENEELQKANRILKAAAAFFSQDHLK
jgi:transposase